jgi:low affinity Fe/Cu permease
MHKELHDLMPLINDLSDDEQRELAKTMRLALVGLEMARTMTLEERAAFYQERMKQTSARVQAAVEALRRAAERWDRGEI